MARVGDELEDAVVEGDLLGFGIDGLAAGGIEIDETFAGGFGGARVRRVVDDRLIQFGGTRGVAGLFGVAGTVQQVLQADVVHRGISPPSGSPESMGRRCSGSIPESAVCVRGLCGGG